MKATRLALRLAWRQPWQAQELVVCQIADMLGDVKNGGGLPYQRIFPISLSQVGHHLAICQVISHPPHLEICKFHDTFMHLPYLSNSSHNPHGVCLHHLFYLHFFLIDPQCTHIHRFTWWCTWSFPVSEDQSNTHTLPLPVSTGITHYWCYSTTSITSMAPQTQPIHLYIYDYLQG